MKTLKYNTTIVLLFFSVLLMGQTKKDESECTTKFDSVINRTIYVVVDSMPCFPGGTEALYDFLGSNLPKPGINSIERKVYVYFIVEKDGKLTNITIAKGDHEATNKEAIRVINLMPKWKPGECKGKKVVVKYLLPLRIWI